MISYKLLENADTGYLKVNGSLCHNRYAEELMHGQAGLHPANPIML